MIVKISIIIPVLNEASHIADTLATVREASNVEVIVVDGGSDDETVAIAQSMGAKIIAAGAGRASQMNAGAAVATGDILLFLHADTRLPKGFDTLVREGLQDHDTVAGAFELAIDANLRGVRLIERMVNLRSRFCSLPYGDQAIFIKTKVFTDLGGFLNLPIMEDFDLMRRLRHLGKITILSQPVLTSGRRWQTLGVVKTTLINQLVIVAYHLGVSPHRIVGWYRRAKG
ncbi:MULTISPECIES: TIGR04283 family arsenosugar biosynthesis glycosyltransferase [Moorena]|uniref:4,4'-diaponeurosporenoate glycosyltransferase n=1 Tax=Moorena producens 3L TaxID=489825 RepID=F4XP08_9CYAN|nr:TIGR04283 family arsenosugar biosynthesis glycosyltransferase [Moorena producens]EGJ33779.1 glycosyltransferase involved in cell wall biogenesis [Moorena producens 3L]OLT64492.1 glycosyltransferase [Moorena producens 3L]